MRTSFSSQHLFKFLACGVSIGSLSFASIARADCSYPSPSSDEALIARVGFDIPNHQARYDSGSYIFGSDDWPMPLRQDEFNSHFFATLLIRQGIKGDNPPLRQDPASGAWEYDPDGIIFTNNFHRSWDGYGPLALDVWQPACQGVEPSTGGYLCGSDIFGQQPNFGHSTFTSPEDLINGDPNIWGMNGPSWDLLRDPDSQIRYSCSMFDNEWGVSGVAQTIVHENWHSTGILHKDGVSPPNANNSCSAGAGSCDEYVWGRTSYTDQYYGLENLKHRNVGAYQVGAQFLCDLVEEPADWIPLQTWLDVEARFNVEASKSRYTNVPVEGSELSISGALPFTCGRPAGVLLVPVDGVSFCDGTTKLRCNVPSDCGNRGDDYVWLCQEGCCDRIDASG